MKNLKIFSIIWLAAMLVLGLGFEAQAAKSIEVGTAIVNNLDTEELRTKDLPITLKGGFNDANGLAFTLVYNKDIFDFVGLVQNTMTIDDGAGYNPASPPSPATVAATIYYQANNKANQGCVLISAAAANFLATNTADVIPFKARFRVKVGQGSGTYPVNLQQTIIGPDTAAAAGYTTFIPIPVAVGLAPTADPTTASAFPVSLVAGGSITVSGGYTINGIVQYAGGTPANGATVQLLKKVDGIYSLNATTLVSGGNFSFSNKSAGTYKLVVLSSNPGFQRRYDSADITVVPYNAGTITLAAYTPLAGKITVNGVAIPGVKAKIMDGETLIGYFSVDANGNFVTPPLDPTGTYTIIAVYGSAKSDAFTGTKDWSLEVGTLSGAVSGLTTGQNVMLHIVSSTAQLEKTLAKTGDGNPVSYQFTNLLPAADYIVSIVGDGIPVAYYKAGENMGVSDIALADKLTVSGSVPPAAPPDTPNINFNFAGLNTKTITGTISKDSVNKTGVPVFALNTSTPEMYSVFSGTGGVYTLTVKNGTYTVFAFNNGKTFYYDAVKTTQVESEADSIDVNTSDASGKNISLDEQNGIITGQVTYRRLGGDPVADIMVTAVGPKGSAVAVTNESGNYTLSGLSNEAYNVTIYPNAPYPRQTFSVTATPEGTARNFVIHTGWVLSGTVNSDTTPFADISSAWTYLVNSNGNIQGIPAFSNAGSFTLADIPAGVYTLKAEHPDYRPKSVNLDIQSDILGYALTLTPGGSITGIVSDDSGTLSNVTIIATAVGETARFAYTNISGAYALNGLNSGAAYFLRVSKQGYVTQFVQETATAATVRDFTLAAPANQCNFGGTVQETGGNVIGGAIVVVSSAAKSFFASTTTTTGGAFSFSQLIADDYRIAVIPGNNRPVYIEEKYTLSVNTSDYVINIQNGSISGTITLSDSATGADVTVYLIDAQGNYVTDVTASAGGTAGTYTYSFGGVQASTDFKVVAYAPGYNIRWFNNVADFTAAPFVQSGNTAANITLLKQ